MTDNLVFYINKLSHLIVAQELENEKNHNLRAKSEKFFKSCVQKVRQKGCDVLLNKIDGTRLEDPCVTDYGGNWRPATLITDYGRELKAQGAVKANDLLLSCMAVLEEKEFHCINDLFKLLLLLKRPFDKDSEASFQNDLLLSGSDFLLDSIDSLSFLSEDFSSEALNKGSFKKAFHYEESWTKNFDPKFQFPREHSKKNLLSLDKVSLNSLFSSKAPMVNLRQSHSNFFVFTDFFHMRNLKSDKNLFGIYSNYFTDDTPLLDSFVDHPISHKLPSLSLNSKIFSSTGCRDWTNSGTKEKQSYESGVTYNTEDSRKSSVIELKRNSNCSHSFSILYKKSANSGHSSLGSNDSNLFLKKKKRERDKSLSRYSSSKDIILGLWEQERSLIREFKPELASNFPCLRMISLREFVEDVKYLFTGINSGTFQYDSDKNEFNMIYGTCLEDLMPESLFHFSKEFLEIGNCYVKLSSCLSEIGKNNFDTCTTTTQAFWKSIFDYLELHYSLVLDIPNSTNLMSLKSCTREIHEIIITVANICKIFRPKESLPKGGELLNYLLEFTEKTSKQSVTNILLGILLNCCSVYFMCILQSWMFRGKLDNHSNEFFVDCRRPKIEMRSRAYYNSFFIIPERIPTFLRGYEESIYNCGKSIHFLKLFNIEDKFCQLLDKADYPAMQLCFSETQLEELEAEFMNYEEFTLKSCGERITIKTIRDEEKEKEKCYLDYVREFKIAQEKEQEKIQKKKLQEMREKKQKQNKLLDEQRSFIEAEKLRKKQEEEEEKLRLEEAIKKAEEKRENLFNKQKSLLKCYYDEMLHSLERKKNIAEARKKSLRKILSKEKNKTFVDGVNDNEIQTDEEGNVTSEIDINSNACPANSEKLFRVVEEELEWKENEGVLKNLADNIDYDENSNPSRKVEFPTSKTNWKSEETNKNSNEEASKKTPKSVSFRTIAAEEAEKNKCKILRSEFGLPLRSGFKSPEKKRSNVMTDLEKNKKKVLESEYNILLKSGDTQYLVPRMPSPETVKDVSESSLEKNSDNFNKTLQTACSEDKVESVNLKNSAEKARENESTQSGSSDSLMMPPNDLSIAHEPNICEEVEGLRSRESSSILNDKYQDALVNDSKIFHSKSIHNNIFCSLKEENLDNLPCTDFLKFQRFLKKSVLIPLRVQEKLANDALLRHMLKGENLLSHLNSLRGYFFLYDGEFGRSFTQHTFRSLAKCTEPEQFFERSNLSTIVNEALNYTIHSFEPNAQNLSFRIVKMPVFLNHSSHDVLSPFELSYKVNWPLNIILTEKALNKYKMVFRFLLKLKRINWTLNENFMYLNWHFKSKKLNGKILVGSTHYHKIQIFRHAMTQVIITLDDYIFSNGVQLSWIFFLKDLETTENIEDLYQKHVRYIKDVLTRCFLSKNSEDLLECIHSLIELALKFHYTAKSSLMEVVDGKYVHPKFSVLKATFNEFCSVIKMFLKTLKEKISLNKVIRAHYVLIEKFDLKLT